MEQAGFVFQYQFATEGEREAYEQAYSESYSECQKQLYTEGYQIYTSFDLSFRRNCRRQLTIPYPLLRRKMTRCL